ncbi:hypothetical protein ACOJQI_01095 [Bacillus salacetis]|uniref:hypothetical protein n=1 Tax=Bacillus salacetis TaxID=2315464 RepID=UPI003B9DE81F
MFKHVVSKEKCYHGTISLNRKGEMMAEILQKPFGGDHRFEEIIEGKRSLVVFVRHPG